MVNKEQAREDIKKLIDKYHRLLSEGKLKNLNEDTTKSWFIEPLFIALGWDVHSEDVTKEEKVSKGRVDYGFRTNGILKFFLEAKPVKADLDNKSYIEQAINYAWHKGCTWTILTNFEELKVYNAELKNVNPFQNIFLSLNVENYLDNFEKLWWLSRDGFENNSLDKEATVLSKRTRKIPVDKQLLNDLTKFREMISKNITKHNSISEEDLDESVQRIIDRLIFIRTLEDRQLESQILQPLIRESSNKRLYKRLNEKFRDIDNIYNSKLFSKHLCEELIIDDEVLEKVINGLFITSDKTLNYDFSLIDADVLGNIYEQYLGHVLKKTAKVAKVTEKHAHRKEQGIYYTPTYIVDYIVKNTIGEILKNKKVDVSKIRILDPACGSGSFLIKAFDVLNGYYKKKDKTYEQTKLDALGSDAPFTKKVEILKNNIFGVDLDPKAVEIAQLNLLLKIAEKGHRLPLLQQNIKIGNSLVDDKNIAGDKAFNWRTEFKDIISNGGFDIVIGNPPYIRIQTLNEKDVDFFNSHYKSATKNYDIYALFVERGMQLLKDGGILGFILPSKFFNADYGTGLRKVIAENKSLYQVVDFKDFQVFEEATTYTCLLFLKKDKNKNFDYYSILNKDNVKQLQTLSLDAFNKSKQDQPSGEHSWNFVSENGKNIMNKLNNIKLRLGDMSQNIFQGLVTGADKFYFVYVVEDKEKMVKIKNKYDGKEYIVEKALLKKLLKGKEIRKWSVDWQDIYIIYPYLVQNGRARLIPLEEIKQDYPKTYDYFITYEKELRARENNRFKNEKNWHQFGRLQNIEKFEQCKIMTQVLASKNSFTLDEKGEYYFVGGGNAGGYGIKLNEKHKNDYLWVLALLNSKALEFYLRNISTPFRGGFYSYGKRFIGRLPIVIPNEKEKSRLVKLTTEQLRLASLLIEFGDKKTDQTAKIERELIENDKEINGAVYNIYGLTEEEKKIIEESLSG